VEKNLVQEVHGAGLRILVWTVNDPEDMQRLADWAVDGIISDDTQLLVRSLT
jgi:glycerophosphoryl diester phosphodiesterase